MSGDDGNTHPDDRIDQLRLRVHKLADQVQEHEGRFISLETIIPMFKEQLESIRVNSATRDSVDSAVKTLSATIEANAKVNGLELQQIKARFDPIQRGIYAVVGLVIMSVLGALLALVLTGGVK